MVFLVVWTAVSILVGWVAGQRGRSVIGWFLISFLLSPIFGLILLVVCPVIPQAYAAPPAPRIGPIAPRLPRIPWINRGRDVWIVLAVAFAVLVIANEPFIRDSSVIGFLTEAVGQVLFWFAVASAIRLRLNKRRPLTA